MRTHEASNEELENQFFPDNSEKIGVLKIFFLTTIAR